MDRPYIHTSTDILADFGAEVVEGRGTRVFEGYRKGDSDKTPVVIKDTRGENAIAAGKTSFLKKPLLTS